MQDGRSTLRMPSVGDDEQSVTSHGRLPVPEAEPYEGDLVTGPQEGAGRARHPDLPRPSVVSDADSTREMTAPKSAGGGRRGISVGDDRDEKDAGDEARRSRAERRGEKRHGIGLMLTGGFAGIIVVAFLLYGNAGGGGDGAPAGNVVAAGPTGSSTASTASLTVTASATASAAEATSASASPTHTASASPSKSSTPEQATTSAAPDRSATATATRTTASASPTSASPTAKPSPSSTKSSCWLIFCT